MLRSFSLAAVLGVAALLCSFAVLAANQPAPAEPALVPVATPLPADAERSAAARKRLTRRVSARLQALTPEKIARLPHGDGTLILVRLPAGAGGRDCRAERQQRRRARHARGKHDSVEKLAWLHCRFSDRI